MVLQPDPAHPVGQGQQEFIAIEVVGAEGQPRLGYQVAVQVDLFGLGSKLLGLVRHDIERDVLPQVPLRKMLAGEQRRIDQDLVTRLVP